GQGAMRLRAIPATSPTNSLLASRSRRAKHDGGGPVMNIVQSTRAFEGWLRRHTPLNPSDVRFKHQLMERTAFEFLRATFYRWAQIWPQVCPKLAHAPAVLAVGDRHVENFGTWRDAEGRLVWGMNDFDEAYPLPYTNDLVRLATSAMLARRERRMNVGRQGMCAAILEGYRAAIEKG